MRVLVVGVGNSAADISTELIGHAKKIYLSHRGGAKLVSKRASSMQNQLNYSQVPRICLGMPLDLIINRQKNLIKFWLEKYFPSLTQWLFDAMIEYYSKKSFKLDPSWKLSPAPSLANHQPVITDNLVSSLWAGDITSVSGLRSFFGDDTVELLDGTKLVVDAVVFCTGYEPDFSLVSGLDPTADVSYNQKNTPYRGPPLARLYQNIFPVKYADSVAYMNYIALTDGAITVIDLASMAIAQIWKGNSRLPSRKEMNETIDKHQKWVKGLADGDTVYAGIVRPGLWYAFLNSAAGTQVDEKLGYGLEGWKFWFKERKLSNLMMTGVMTPYMYRIFDGGKRKMWCGARDAIIHANEHAKLYCS
jgi:dimethylaniline monooxygenase (N-oxide forming)